MLVDGFYCVLRTARRVAAAAANAEQWAQQILIGSNWDNQEFSHCLITFTQCLSRFDFNCALSTNIIGRRTMITMSLAGKRCLFFRKLSRKILFNRFLSTALFICFFAIANPSLGVAPTLLPTNIVMTASPTRLLLLKSCRYCSARVSLSFLGNDSLSRIPTLVEGCSLRRQARPSLGSTRFNYLTTAACLHTRAKSMGSGPL